MHVEFYKNFNIKEASEKELESVLNEIIKGIKKPDSISVEKSFYKMNKKTQYIVLKSWDF